MLVAIPCFAYIDVSSDAEGAVNAELLRIAWDADAPPPDLKLIKPDMEGRIFSMDTYTANEHTPTYAVKIEAERAEEKAFVPDSQLFALLGEHEVTVQARNRYEAQELAARQFFNFYEGAENFRLKILSIRMR